MVTVQRFRRLMKYRYSLLVMQQKKVRNPVK